MFCDPNATEENFKRLKELDVIAEEIECKLVHLALAWVIKFPHSSSALIGARDSNQLGECLGALKVVEKLTKTVEERINKILDNFGSSRMDFLNWRPFPPTRPIAKP